MKQFKISNEIVDDTAALRRVLAEDGYLFFRGVLDQSDVARVRDGLLSWAEGHGLVDRAAEGAVWSGKEVDLAPQPLDLHETGLWQWLVGTASVKTMLRRIFGEGAFVLPITEYHYYWPGSRLRGGIHQDRPFNPGMDFLTFWVPLVPVSSEVGALEIAAGQHRRGSLHPDVTSVGAPGSESFDPWISMSQLPEDSWHSADFVPGDLLVFDGFTPHRPRGNSSHNQLRLSVDFRAMPASAHRPAIGTVLEVHGNQVSIACNDGRTIVLEADDKTLIRGGGYDGVGDFDSSDGRPLLEKFTGRGVVAAYRGTQALIIRSPYGPPPAEPHLVG